MIKTAKQLVLFDFDGTITSKDTLFQIARFSTNLFVYCFKLVLISPSLVLMKIGWLNNQQGKEMFLRVFFHSYSKKQFNKLCQSFIDEKLPSLIRPKALHKIMHLGLNDSSVNVIVSASPENWIRPWADTHGFEVIATKLKFDDDVFKGKIDGKNCNGEEKVVRIKEALDLSQFEKIIAYGDSKGDVPMLALAHEKHLKPFK